MTTDINCIDACPFAGDGLNFYCDGECQTIKPIETLTDEQIQRGKGSSLILEGDE